MSRRAKIISAVVVVLAIAGVVAFFVLRLAGGGPQVDTATVRLETLSVSVQASGKVQPGLKADLFPPAAGTLDEIFVEDGQGVKAGQQVAVMDKAPLEIQLAQAESGVKQAKAKLDSIDMEAASSADILAAQSSVTATKRAWQAAKAALASAGSQAPSSGRVSSLRAATAAASKFYDTANATYLAAKAAVDASTAPSPEASRRLDRAEITREQAYSAFMSAKAAEDNSISTGVSASSARAKAQADVDQAYAAYLGALAQLDKLERGDTGTAKAAARAALSEAEDGLAAARENLDRAVFVAPIDGVVFFNPTGTPGADGSTPKPSSGSPVSPTAAPFSVVDLTGVQFSAEVDEADIDRVKTGMTGEISLDAFAGESFESRVIEVRSAAQLTATGGTIFPVEMSLDDTGKNVLIGMKGDANISVSSVGDALVMPIEALFDQNGQSYAYVVKSGKLKRTDIQTGAITDTDVQVMSGLSDGDVVALSGSVQFTDGMSVRTK